MTPITKPKQQLIYLYVLHTDTRTWIWKATSMTSVPSRAWSGHRWNVDGDSAATGSFDMNLQKDHPAQIF